jgi:lipopolysaccharide export system ATP-binding protein
MAILNAEGLVKTYHRRRVVDGISLEVSQGEIVGLLGPNGAGKSTCFKMICGLVRPDKGTVSLLDHNITKLPLYQRSRLGMGYLPQQSSLFAKLSVQANLLGMMQLLKFPRKEQKRRCAQLLEQFNIVHVRKSRAENLSGGERRRLEIARCLVSNPKIIMLDEPFAAIDPVTVQNIQLVIRQLADKGIAILITDHAAREILQITDRTYVVSEGRILCSGSADEIVNHEQVKEKYLGDLDFSRSTSQLPSSANAPLSSSAPKLIPRRPVHSELPVQARKESERGFDNSIDRASQSTDSSDMPTEVEVPAHRPKIVFSTERRAREGQRRGVRSDLD